MTRREDEAIEHPDKPVRRRVAILPVPATATVYIAGIVHTPKSKCARAAAGIFVVDGDDSNKGKCVPAAGEQSQYVAEMYAALEAVRCTNTATELTIVSAQSFARDAMTKKLPTWEHEGWMGVPHRGVLRCLAAELKARKAKTVFKVTESDAPERTKCKKASVLAKRSARAPTDVPWDLTIPQGTALPGLSLQENRQRVFYHSIREMKTRNLTPRPSTTKMLDIVKRDAVNIFGKYVTDADVWRAVAVKEILPKVAQFLWKGLHNAHRIGKFWTHIPECGDRAICQECGVIEDMEHILVKCTSPGQETVWRAAEKLWHEKETHWPTVSLGTVLGCGLAEFRDEKGKPKRGTQRLYRILMSESAYLIWLMRNNRVISRGGAPATEEEIINKWKHAVNQRLQMDRALAVRPKKGKRPWLDPQQVLGTWSSTLDDETSLPADWLREPRVLVGNRAFTQTQTRRQHSRGIG
ncbi:ribonuclease H-like protein [Mycena haematopus]|nr:ribonuclease H-like protein [Mycena haematopus]